MPNPCIDPVEGLRICGDAGFYRHMLGMFLHDPVTDPATLEHCLAEAAAPEMLRRVHSLKGMSANIGATPLREAAKALETPLRLGATDTQPLQPLKLAVVQSLLATRARIAAMLQGAAD